MPRVISPETWRISRSALPSYPRTTQSGKCLPITPSALNGLNPVSFIAETNAGPTTGTIVRASELLANDPAETARAARYEPRYTPHVFIMWTPHADRPTNLSPTGCGRSFHLSNKLCRSREIRSLAFGPPKSARPRFILIWNSSHKDFPVGDCSA